MPTTSSPAELDHAKDLLARLVAFDTTSRNSNLPIIDFIEDYLSGHGIASHRVPDETGEKSSLFATIGPEGVPGVGLSAHTDVVPVDGQDWDTNPFELTRKGDKLYGRGACDMKGFVACVLAKVPDYKARDLATPLHIVFSYDEEVGCTGVRPMISEMGERLTKPRMVIVGEPTNMAVVDAHKGPVRWSVDIIGRPAHSSMAPLGVNTITVAGELLRELAVMEEELKTAPYDERFTPPYTTLQVTEMKAGAASNIVPAECWFGWEIRAMPGVDPDAIEARLRTKADSLLPAMREVAPEADIRITRTNEVPCLRRRSRLRCPVARPQPRRPERNLRRLLRHRSQPLPHRRRPLRRLRPRRHRPGPHRQRVDRSGGVGKVPRVPGTIGRLGGEVRT